MVISIRSLILMCHICSLTCHISSCALRPFTLSVTLVHSLECHVRALMSCYFTLISLKPLHFHLSCVCVCVCARARVWVGAGARVRTCLRACMLTYTAFHALAPPCLSTLSHKRHYFRKKVTEQNVLWFSLEPSFETFLTVRRIQRDNDINVKTFSCRVVVIFMGF